MAMGNAGTRSRFEAALLAIQGRACWAVFYGPSTGATIQLHFEPRVPRRQPILNPALTEQERRFDSEYAVYVSSAWRLEAEGTVLCCSGDAFSHPNKLAESLEQLVGKQLLVAESEPPGWDASLRFSDGYQLHIFCDQSQNHDNYDFYTPMDVFTVGPRSRLSSEDREYG